ncbi:hypothetical protein TREES_T100013051 [Tupaia chinensis]|uniref:Uncharacterized protein n=1 Tax=Tupaia chinensis TaxID=246437 RepID=L9L0C7_TUPCH|nr:hypothetical protein TREES_T100013051 [Tupaia chinensis]
MRAGREHQEHCVLVWRVAKNRIFLKLVCLETVSAMETAKFNKLFLADASTPYGTEIGVSSDLKHHLPDCNIKQQVGRLANLYKKNLLKLCMITALPCLMNAELDPQLRLLTQSDSW